MMAQKENMVNTLWMQVALIGVQLEKMTSQYQVPFFVEVCRYCKPKIKSRKQCTYRYVSPILLLSVLDLLQGRRMNSHCMMKMEIKWRPAAPRRKLQVNYEQNFYVVKLS